MEGVHAFVDRRETGGILAGLVGTSGVGLGRADEDHRRRRCRHGPRAGTASIYRDSHHRKLQAAYMAMRLAVILEFYASACAHFIQENANVQPPPPTEEFPEWTVELPELPAYPDDADGWRAIDRTLAGRCLNLRPRFTVARASSSRPSSTAAPRMTSTTPLTNKLREWLRGVGACPGSAAQAWRRRGRHSMGLRQDIRHRQRSRRFEKAKSERRERNAGNNVFIDALMSAQRARAGLIST